MTTLIYLDQFINWVSNRFNLHMLVKVSPFGRRGSKTTPSPDQSSSSSGSEDSNTRAPGRNRYRSGSRNNLPSTSTTEASSSTSSPSSFSRPSFGADRCLLFHFLFLFILSHLIVLNNLYVTKFKWEN